MRRNHSIRRARRCEVDVAPPGVRISRLILEGRYAEARRGIRERLKQEPDSHWLLTRLATTYYEEHNYKLALRYSERAIELAPRCPLVLWDYACVLHMIGRDDEAIALGRSLLKRGVHAIAFGPCGEGLSWAKSLLNDSRYLISRCYKDAGDLRQAIRWLKLHVSKRCQGTRSIYRLASVKSELRRMCDQDIHERRRNA